MTTSGSFTPPSVPECAYAPQMTRAQAIARRTAGTLDPNCVVVITDGPVIGTAGNTSPTQIELNPVSSTDLGMSARVHQLFHPASAWDGIYDVDLGAAGSIKRLTDHWNNTAQDANADSPTVHAQVPWHKGSATFRDNFFDESTLPGWDAAGGTLNDNKIMESTVDLTGKTSGTFNQNTLTGSTFTSRVPTAFIAYNDLTQGVVSHLGTTAGSFSFQNNTMLTGSLTVDAATTSLVTANNNIFGGTAGGYRIQVVGKTSVGPIISGNKLFNPGLGAYDLKVSGAGIANVTSNDIGAGAITLDGLATAEITDSKLSNATITHSGSGALHVGTSSVSGSSVVSAVGSTRGLTLDGVLANGSTVTQNGTGSANIDSFPAGTGTLLQRATVTLNATAAGTPASTFSGLTAVASSSVSVGDHTVALAIDNSRIDTGSTLAVSGGGTFVRSRLSSEATLTTSAAITASVMEGQFSKTVASVNTNKLCNKSFDDWIL